MAKTKKPAIPFNSLCRDDHPTVEATPFGLGGDAAA
jgi:hypothetical protein